MAQALEQKTSTEPFDISIDIQARVIGLVGAVDIATAPLLLAAATSLFGLHPGELTLDLAGVMFADSALLQVIDEITGSLAVDLRLINATAAVKRLFLSGGRHTPTARRSGCTRVTTNAPVVKNLHFFLEQPANPTAAVVRREDRPT